MVFKMLFSFDSSNSASFTGMATSTYSVAKASQNKELLYMRNVQNVSALYFKIDLFLNNMLTSFSLQPGTGLVVGVHCLRPH